MRKNLVGVAAVATALVATAAAGATPRLTKPQYAARANAICAHAHAQIVKLAPLAPIGRTAKIGDRWLSIDRHALAALRALTPPASDRATTTRLLSLTDKTINVGLANLVKAAKSGSASAYATAGAKFGSLLRTSHSAAARYGLNSCATW